MDEVKNEASRREVIGSVGAGLVVAAAATGASAAQAQPKAHSGYTIAEVQQRTDSYPKPPFPNQKQPFPGLARDMQPRPDHGEQSYRGTGRLVGRKALITGGDSGIGRAAAIAYAREGADVAINYLPAEEPDAREVIALIRAEGRKAVAIPGDIRTEQFCNHLVDTAARDLGGLDTVVNVAGRQISIPSLRDFSSEDFDTTFKTNVYAMFWIIKHSLKYLQPGSVIINTASEQAYDPSPDIAPYASTKAAIMNFTKGMAKQLVKEHIRVNAVAPGPFWTPLQVSGGQQPDKLVAFGTNCPMQRPGQPVEIAGVYVALAAADLSFTTGNIYGATGANAAA